MLTDIQIDILVRINTAMHATNEAYKLAVHHGIATQHLKEARSHLIHAYAELIRDELKPTEQ
jgi:hypothetical protein